MQNEFICESAKEFGEGGKRKTTMKDCWGENK